MIRRREFLTGAAALAGMTSQAEAFGFGQLGAGFSHSGAVLGGVNAAQGMPAPPDGFHWDFWTENGQVLNENGQSLVILVAN